VSALEVALFALGLLGLYLMLSSVPLFQARPSLEERLRRFDVSARLHRRHPLVAMPVLRLPWATLDAALRPLLEDLIAPLQHLVLRDGVFGSSVQRELNVVHPGMSRQAFVARQLVWGTAALGVSVAVFATRDQLDAVHLVISLFASFFGFVVPWLQLRRAARTRKRRLLAELPHVARLLALGMSAGLPLDVALAHVGERSHGPLGQLIDQGLRLATAANMPVLVHLAGRAELEDVPELTSFVELLQSSAAQGLPLAPSLETLGNTLEQRAATRLLAAAERGTIKMLFPLALVLTPVVVVVTLVPALLALYALVRGG
jgi:Flp pilus assembly protein TadB